jgi:hypothetical protein
VIRAPLAALHAIAVVALVVVSARAETIVELPKTKATLTLADGWARVATTPAQKVVELFKHDKGHLLAITRADVPNPDAWTSEKKQAYADQVEKGIKGKVPGYKRVAKKLGDANGVPALDVEAKRSDGAIVVVRVLLFRTYALSVAVEVPKGGDIAIARDVIKTFAPPKEPPATDPKTTSPPKKAG